MRNEYEKLSLLLSQGQFELLLPEPDAEDNIRLIYLMNDAVESFLVFHEAELMGAYDPDFQRELRATMERSKDKNVLIVYQGETVCTIFFRTLALETHMFNYGRIGHFWVKGYEYLRQLEYPWLFSGTREYIWETSFAQKMGANYLIWRNFLRLIFAVILQYQINIWCHHTLGGRCQKTHCVKCKSLRKRQRIIA